MAIGWLSALVVLTQPYMMRNYGYGAIAHQAWVLPDKLELLFGAIRFRLRQNHLDLPHTLLESHAIVPEPFLKPHQGL